MVTSPLPAAGVLGAVPAVAAAAPTGPFIPIIVAGAVSIAALILVWKLIDSIKSEGATDEGIKVTVNKNADVNVEKTKTPSKMTFSTTKERTDASAPTSDLKNPEVASLFKAGLAAGMVTMLVTNGIPLETAQKTVYQTINVVENNQPRINTQNASSAPAEGVTSVGQSTLDGH